MAWPPPTFRVDYTDATPQQTQHKDAHNSVNDSLNQDFVPKIDAVQADADAAQASADQVAADLADHEGNGTTVSGFMKFRIQVNDFITHAQWWPIIYYPSRHGIHRIRQTDFTPAGGTPYTYNSNQTLTPQLQWRIVENADDWDTWHPNIPVPNTRADIGSAQFWLSSASTVPYRTELTRNGDSDYRMLITDLSRQGGLGDGRMRAVGSENQDRTPCEVNMRMSIRLFWWS